MTPERRRKYRQGWCDAMAIALHRLTGFPLVKICGEIRSGRSWCEEPAHVAVKVGSSWLDVDGLHQGIPRSRLLFLRDPDRIRIKPTTEHEVRTLYTVSGVPEHQIKNAEKDALEDPLLREILKKIYPDMVW